MLSRLQSKLLPHGISIPQQRHSGNLPISSFLRRQESLFNDEAGHPFGLSQQRHVVPAFAGMTNKNRILRSPYGSAWPPTLVNMAGCLIAAAEYQQEPPE